MRRFDSLNAWLDWQMRLNPRDMELGLERVGAVWQRMAPAHFAPRVITVGGTNGKGSTVALFEAMLRAAGFRVGCYTSPHLLRYNERIRIDGLSAPDESICAAFEAVERVRGGVPLTYFEFGTLAALWLFMADDLDVAVLEVGLGGRLDAVNILAPDLAVITAIGIDHTDWLGPARGGIALEKAGILRPHRPAVLGDRDPPPELLAYAPEHQVPLQCSGRDFDLAVHGESWDWTFGDQSLQGLPWPALPGRLQLENAAAALTGLHLLRDALPVSRDAIEQGLRAVRLPGRFQVLPGQPQVILDVAHNPHAVARLVENLGQYPCAGRTLAVCGMLANKDAAEAAALMRGRVERWFLGGLAGSRGRTAEDLRAALVAGGLAGADMQPHAAIPQALAAALEQAEASDRILVFGSFYTVEAALNSGLLKA